MAWVPYTTAGGVSEDAVKSVGQIFTPCLLHNETGTAEAIKTVSRQKGKKGEQCQYTHTHTHTHTQKQTKKKQAGRQTQRGQHPHSHTHSHTPPRERGGGRRRRRLHHKDMSTIRGQTTRRAKKEQTNVCTQQNATPLQAFDWQGNKEYRRTNGEGHRPNRDRSNEKGGQKRPKIHWKHGQHERNKRRVPWPDVFHDR